MSDQYTDITDQYTYAVDPAVSPSDQTVFTLSNPEIWSPPPTITITGPNNEHVYLTWKRGKLVVEGIANLDISAKIFFDFLKPYIDNYIKDIAPFGNLEYLEYLYAKKHGGLK